MLEMSLSAPVLIGAIVLVRCLTLHKLPKMTFPVLWGVALCRLLIPFTIPSRFSVYSLANVLTARLSGNDAPVIQVFPADRMGWAAGAIRPAMAAAPAASTAPVGFIWLAGLTGCALFFLVTHFRCRREYKTALPIDNDFVSQWLSEHPIWRKVQIRQSDKIASPLTYGIFRPVVLLPKATDWTDETGLRYILTHEFVHIRRVDVLTKLLLVSALCVHWFNPFVWVMYVLFNRDIELSCDETVVRTFGESMKSAYALTLIGLEEKKSRLTPLANNFSKNFIEERVASIMKIKKTSLVGIVLALTLVIGTTVIFATGAVAPGDNGISSGMRIAGKTGTTSMDGGETWMDEEEYQKQYPTRDRDIVWWTYDQYKAWLEQKKTSLQTLANAPGWSQERVNAAIQRYEQMLEDIKNGARYSKSIEGYDETVAMGSNITDSIAVTHDKQLVLNPSDPPSVRYSVVLRLENGDTKDLGSFETIEQAVAALKAFYDEQVKAGKMTQRDADKILDEYK